MSQQKLKPPPEVLYADELTALQEEDTAPKPKNWNLSPAAVKKFIVGDEKIKISKKFYGNDVLVERAIVTLAGNRGLLLVGEPGTAKSMLSELITAAISGSSQLTIQGTAGTTDDQIKYSWNYAALLAKGPSEESLVPSPLLTALREGKIVRFEEITRCQPEIQDSLVSVLSDKVLLIPELGEEQGTVFANAGFNVIATANLRDRGVNEMSSALKRRFNFETIAPIADKELEMQIVEQQTKRLLQEHNIDYSMSNDTLDLLITTFRDLREGQTTEGASFEKPSTVMSTAEAVGVSLSACLDAHYFGENKVTGAHITRQIVGTVFKDEQNDAKKLDHYLNVIAKARSKRGGVWKEFYQSRGNLS